MQRRLSKTDLTVAIALSCDLPQTTAREALDAAIRCIQHSLSLGEDVRITGFGTFRVRTRPRRAVRNPQTGEVVTVPETRLVRFVPGSALKEAVN